MKRFPLILFGLLLLWPAAGGFSQSVPALDKAALEEYVRYINLWPAEVTVTFGEPQPSTLLPGFFDLAVTASVPNASLVQNFLISSDGKRLIRARAADRLGRNVFATDEYPFAEEKAALRLDGMPSLGPPDAPVTVAVFSDFQCGFCRDEAKLLRSNLLSAYPDSVRLVFADFPLSQIHDWAKPAAVAGFCVAAQGEDKFWNYHDWVFDKQPGINAGNFTAQLNQWAAASGVDSLQLAQCLQSEDAEKAIAGRFERAMRMGLNSTPTLFINGRQVGGKLEWAGLKQIIDAELNYQTAAAKKKEECCTVSLPGVFAK